MSNYWSFLPNIACDVISSMTISGYWQREAGWTTRKQRENVLSTLEEMSHPHLQKNWKQAHSGYRLPTYSTLFLHNVFDGFILSSVSKHTSVYNSQTHNFMFIILTFIFSDWNSTEFQTLITNSPPDDSACLTHLISTLNLKGPKLIS